MMAPASIRDRLTGLRSRPRVLMAAVGAFLLLAWLGYLSAVVPSVSRGDFFLAMVRLARSVEQGDLLYAVTWPLHILGGHIVFYERVLQLTNYYVFDFSPHFVKAVAMITWVLLAVGVFRFVRRLDLPEWTRFACLLLLALLTFNVTPWFTIVWADATIPYLSSLVVLLLVAPTLVRAVNEGNVAAWRIALCMVLVIFGSGVGWSILPAMAWLYALRMFRDGRLRRFLLVAGAGLVFVAVAAWVAVTFFPLALRLGLVEESLANLPGNLGRVLAYFLSLFATFFAISERPWNLWLGGAVFFASLLAYAAWRRRATGASEAELLYVFGVLGMVLVSLGRWKLAVDRGDPSPQPYYHMFALPAYYGFVAMALGRLRIRGSSAWAGVVLLAALLPFHVGQMPAYHRKAMAQRYDYQQMIVPIQGWRMTESSRLIGEPEINHEIYFEFLPMMKRDGKYPQLSERFHPYRSSRMAPPVATPPRSTCSTGYRDLHLLHAEPDVRAIYGAKADLPDYRRFVGVARAHGDCDAPGIAVSLVSDDGTVSCRTWTTPNVHWHFDVPEHRSIAASGFAFDFTCPVTPGGYFLVSQDRDGAVLDAVRVLP